MGTSVTMQESPVPVGPSGQSVLHGPDISYTGGFRVDAYIAMHAAQHPDRPALRWRGRDVSYGALAEHGRRAAAGLAARGVGAGAVVAVHMRRRPAFIAALLGVMQCGAVYAAVPRDWPIARVAELCRQAGVTLFVSDDPDALAGLPVEVVSSAELIRGQNPAPAAPDPDNADDPCCVFLTSGSTGAPKAILAPHRGILRMALTPTLALNESTFGMQIAPVCWDMFAFDLWLPLIRGGRCLLHDQDLLTAADLRAAIASGVNTVWLTASLFNAILEDDPTCYSGLRLLVAGGERLSARHVASCHRWHPGLRLVNGYGPAEATILATLHPIGADDTEDVPIGLPVANTMVYLLDEGHEVVAAGKTGEIAIAGDGVAHGYIGDPAETARCFRVLPLGPDEALVRVYLTGDLAVIDADRRLRYLGRRDRQFKLRGVRVEPAEVERVIGALPGVGQVAVLGLPVDDTVKTRLAAFFTHTQGDGPDGEAIRSAVRSQLPAGFVPDVALRVRKMPRTGNGKLDRRALEAMVQQGDPASASAAAAEPEPADPTLAAVLEHASALLGVRPLASADLFDLGATSLTAIRLANRLQRGLRRQIQVRDIIRLRTPQLIAEHLNGQPVTTSSDEIADLGERLTPAQTAFLLLERMTPGAQDFINSTRLRIQGRLDVRTLEVALVEVIRRHEALRTVFPHGNCRVIPPHDVSSPLTVVRAEHGDTGDVLVRDFLRRPFSLDTEIPVRALLVVLGPDRYVLAIAIHHIAVDGWSHRLFCRDLSEAYARIAEGTPMPADAPTSYRRVADQQLRDRTRTGFAQITSYWRDLLRDVPPMPFGDGLGRAFEGPMSEVPVRLTEDLLKSAANGAALAGGVPSAVLLAAYAQALADVLGIRDMPVSQPLAGRAAAEAEDVIGCFSNMWVMRFRLDSDDPRSLVYQAIEQLEVAMEYQDVTYDRLTRAVGARPSAWNQAHHALFAVQEDSTAAFSLAGASVEAERFPQDVSSYNMMLELWPERLEGTLRYRTDVITDETAQGIARAWERSLRELCESMLAQSSRSLGARLADTRLMS